MDRSEFITIRKRLGLSTAELAAILSVHHVTIRKWETDPAKGSATKVPPTVARVMRWMLEAEGRPDEWPPMPGADRD